MEKIEAASKSAALLVRYHARVGLGAMQQVRSDVSSVVGDVRASCPGREGGDEGGRQHQGPRGGAAHSFDVCLTHFTIDHAPLASRGTVHTPNRDTSNIWALVTLLPYSS